MSKLADKIYDLLKELFPHNIIMKEYYVNYEGTRLFFDFYLKDLDIVFECQGRQHAKFVKHFHQDRDGFFELLKRDNLKKEYAEINKIPFVIIEYNKDINRDSLLQKIIKAQIEVLRDKKNGRNNNKKQKG